MTVDVRCVGSHPVAIDKPCGRLMAVVSDDFAGVVSVNCNRCHALVVVPPSADVEDRDLTCGCGKWLARGRVENGWLQLLCPRERALVRVLSDVIVRIEESRKPPGHPPKEPTRRGVKGHHIGQGQMLAIMEQRWENIRVERLKRRAELAVGLRFDVFNRDGFRCRYCGRGPDQGTLLEADHVVPRADGGADVLANLVTACWDCNRGKSKKRIESA